VVEDSVLLPGARVGEGVRVVSTIVGPNAHVGEGATVTDCVLGEGADVAAGAHLEGERVAAAAPS
jgi:glucose-1-phosphate adenylyltransferase